ALFKSISAAALAGAAAAGLAAVPWAHPACAPSARARAREVLANRVEKESRMACSISEVVVVDRAWAPGQCTGTGGSIATNCFGLATRRMGRMGRTGRA